MQCARSPRCRGRSRSRTPARRSTSTRRSPADSGSTRSSGSSRTSPSRRCTPRKYNEIKGLVGEQRAERERYVTEAGAYLAKELDELGVEAEISGRAKHFYSIYSKMTKKGREFNEIYALTTMRVIVGSVKDCYGAVGVIHSLWKPLPGHFKDFIAMPKFNMYQSLHTTVIGPEGQPAGDPDPHPRDARPCRIRTSRQKPLTLSTRVTSRCLNSRYLGRIDFVTSQLARSQRRTRTGQCARCVLRSLTLESAITPCR